MSVPALDQDRFLSFTVVDQLLSATSETVADIVRNFTLSLPLIRTEEALDLERIYVGSPPRGGAHPHKFVLYAPKIHGGSTVLITNLRDGWSSLSYMLAKRLGTKQVQVIATNRDESSQVYFQAWAGGVRRSVMCMRDSHAWVFHTQGEPMPFENLAAYAERRVSRRLTRKMALDYVMEMGWDASNPEFWRAKGDATYFEQARFH